MKRIDFVDGTALLASATERETFELAREILGEELSPLIIADPPYGNIVKAVWDRVGQDDKEFAHWMVKWTSLWTELMYSGGAFYVWGGIGKPNFRPFFRYVPMVEEEGSLQLANLITWSKKRGYGVQKNYLFTREECAYFVKGDAKHPRAFNIPLLSTKRGYAGYNKKYPAKSDFYRRTNVWTDITEVMRNKLHPTQKTQKLHEIMIEVHTNPGEWVVDPFAGCGTTAVAARKLGRKFLLVENDEKTFNELVTRLG
jgi:site-specific DNA-methyltransferase (adenine-specific)